MDNYQLAKLVQWAGTLQTRKRLQKVVYLLQSRKCPLEADFFLHHYGPYSNEVARLTDTLVKSELLIERESETQSGRKFDYTLSEKAVESLKAFEETDRGQAKLSQLAPFERIAKRLLSTDLSELEYASTIAYFKDRCEKWEDAHAQACEFKRLSPESSKAQAALSLARDVAQPPEE